MPGVPQLAIDGSRLVFSPGFIGVVKAACGQSKMTEGVEVDMLGLIALRVIRISQDCPKGVMEHNTDDDDDIYRELVDEELWSYTWMTSSSLVARPKSTPCHHSTGPRHPPQALALP